MTKDHWYRLIFEEFLDRTEDGFIVVDKDGVITDINQNYCDFLSRKREDIVGKPIGQVITTTSMYDVLSRKLRGDVGRIYIQPYSVGETRDQSEVYAVANRFCFFEEDGTLLGAAAHMKFRQRAMDTARELQELELQYYKEAYQQSFSGKGGFSCIVGQDPKLLELKRYGIQVARTDFPVLITGETGTGKEVFAKAIHLESDRRDGPFIAVNCGALPKSLIEAELFGYESGSFTGAKREGCAGKFELANGGTIFLDEIGDMPFDVQVTLLRVLQNREIRRIGASKTVHIDVRIITATNQNLEELVAQHAFREDLFYRINVFHIQIPPLRARTGDVRLLAEYFLRKYVATLPSRGVEGFSPDAMAILEGYSWPGNVRQLENTVERAVYLADTPLISPADLPQEVRDAVHSRAEAEPAPSGAADRALSIRQGERERIEQALHQTHGNVKQAAELLEISRRTLYRKLDLYQIDYQDLRH